MRGTLSDWAAVREGCLNNLTNPKSLIFMFAFLPQFTDPAAGPIWSQLLILGIIQKATGILSLVPVALAAGTLGQWLHQWPRLLAWQERFSGTVMLVLGLRVAIVGTGTGR
jgi:threonine/homoserine/homoserine lactone efflux protein